MGEDYSIVRCAHYRDSFSTCKAGIDPKSVTDAHGRLPCVVIRGITGQLVCAKLALPAPALVDEGGEMARALARLQAGRCPKCDKLIAGEMEFNGAILALPCRHVLRTDLGDE